MAEVMPQVMKGDIGDLLPLLSDCPLLEGAPPGMQPSLGESPGVISPSRRRGMLSLGEKDKRAVRLDVFALLGRGRFPPACLRHALAGQHHSLSEDQRNEPGRGSVSGG